MQTRDKLAVDGGTPAVPKADTRRRLIGPSERGVVLRLMDQAMAHRLAFDRYGGVEVDAYE
jgi:hypothetical protein